MREGERFYPDWPTLSIKKTPMPSNTRPDTDSCHAISWHGLCFRKFGLWLQPGRRENEVSGGIFIQAAGLLFFEGGAGRAESHSGLGVGLGLV